MLTPEVVCYLETYPVISKDDKDVYPNYVVMESLELLYYGEQFEDVLMNVQSQIEEPTTDEYISALDYYSKHDVFMDFKSQGGRK